MAESEFTKKCCGLLEQQGAMVYPIVAQTMGVNGWPDRLIVTQYWMWLIEFKGYNTPLRVRQRLILEKLNRTQPGCGLIIRQANPRAGGKRHLIGIPDAKVDGTGVRILTDFTFEEVTATTEQPQPFIAAFSA